MNKVLWLREHGNSRGIITASTGNHGMGVARALNQLGIPGRIVIPENTASIKVDALRSYGAEIEIHGPDCFVSETYARETAEREGLTYISPYNDTQVIGGQGTIGPEVFRQCPFTIDNIFVTIGGGGLISGVAAYLRSVVPEIRIIGCQPENSPEMTLSIREGRYVTVEARETLSDASAGAFEEGSITYPLCKELIDDYALVPENEIAAAIRLVLAKERKLVEGSAAVAIASLIRNKEAYRGQTSVIVICGGNISADKLRKVLKDDENC